MMMKHAKLTRIQSLLLRSSPTIRSSIHSFNSVTEEDVFAANENHRYCRLHMAHCMRKLPSHDTGCLLTCVNDLKIVSMRVMSAQETSHGAENRRLVVSLMEPTIEYIMKCIFRNASEKQVGDVLVELGVGLNQKELLGRFPCVSTVLHHLLKQLPSEVVSSRAVEILHLIECSRDDSLDQCLNYRLLELQVVDAFVDIVLQNHMDEHLSSILEGISKRACTKGIADDDLATLQSILVKLLSYCKDIEDIFSMNHFLKILDLMQCNGCVVAVLGGCARYSCSVAVLLACAQW
ncbi:hypothetical protein D8674_038525 [Pyrus ussuriensis x Pyrus communis]|uniref:Uncharacterized protein n=1 Tax=Pyrus ussuriensis x Pyrus communis TaxID=2448454 RepID=A0A5N5G334_9ROSA|nr:hypothetical protein D8674_038525 [Pyrus ussuriensis x Pyrus communis]